MGHEPLRITEPLIVPSALDPDAVKIIRRLKRFGHEAYLVGGCVRDLSLGHVPKDFDIATSARPRQVKRLFRNSRIIGRRFKLVHIQFGSSVIEVSTFRKNPGDTGGDAPEPNDLPLEARDARTDEPVGAEGMSDDDPTPATDRASSDDPATDGDAPRFDDRGPAGHVIGPTDASDGDLDDDGDDDDRRGDLLIRRDNVFGTAEQDAVRRDFTINGLFYDVDENVVIDYVGGTEDLSRRVIRTIGDPVIRFQEDPVRILRAIKFAARLDFTIEPATRSALEEYKVDLGKCASPRLSEELLKLLSCGAARRAIELLESTRVLEVFLPELERFLGEDARIAGFEGSARDFVLKSLEALDELDRGRRVVSNAILLGVLLLGPIRAELSREGGPRDPGLAVDEVLRPYQRHLSISRRDAFQIKQIVIAQPRLLKQRGSRRRRLKPAGLVQRDYFVDALDLFRIECRLFGRDPSEVHFWENLYAQIVEGRRGPHPSQEARDAHDGHDGEHAEAGAYTDDAGAESDGGSPDDALDGEPQLAESSAGGDPSHDRERAPHDRPQGDGDGGGGRRRRRRRRRRGRGGAGREGGAPAHAHGDAPHDDDRRARDDAGEPSDRSPSDSGAEDAPSQREHEIAPSNDEREPREPVEARTEEPRSGDRDPRDARDGRESRDDGGPRRGRRRRGGRGRNRDRDREGRGGSGEGRPAQHSGGRGGDDRRRGGGRGRGNGDGGGPRIEFDEMRAGPLRPPESAGSEPAPVVDEGDDEPDVEIDWEAPFQKVDDPGPISMIRTGIDQTEKKSRRRRKRKDGAQRELAKEVEDQPGLQALKMTEGDPRGHQTTRPQKQKRRPEDDRPSQPRPKPIDFERDFESIDTIFPW